MKSWKPLAVGLGALVIATATSVPFVLNTRSVRPLAEARELERAGFVQAESAGLFVGVRQFTADGTTEVRYAVDDAIDLAYMFALDRRLRLIPPTRIVLALSGDPEKDASKLRLLELKQAGVQVREATERDILSLVERQAAAVGRDGLLVLSLATHGFIRDGVPYVLGSNSTFPAKALSAARIFDVAAASNAARSLIFVDACQQRIGGGTRGASDEPPLIRRMAKVGGQVIFYAAVAGRDAYDDPRRQNGVFTHAVLRGLRCEAYAQRGLVTAQHLGAFVEREVKEWIREHRDPTIRSAIEVTMDGGTENMPLSDCAREPESGDPMIAEIRGTSVIARGSDGSPLWDRALSDDVVRADPVDLDADGTNEVVVGTTSEVVVFDRAGNRRWEAREGTALTGFAVGDLFRRRPRQVVALWSNGAGSRFTIHAPDGDRLATHDRPEALESVVIDRPTARYIPRIVLASATTVLVFQANKPKPLWQGVLTAPGPIEHLQIVDRNNDDRRDIAISMPKRTFFVDFDGNAIGAPAPFQLQPRPRRKP